MTQPSDGDALRELLDRIEVEACACSTAALQGELPECRIHRLAAAARAQVEALQQQLAHAHRVRMEDGAAHIEEMIQHKAQLEALAARPALPSEPSQMAVRAAESELFGKNNLMADALRAAYAAERAAAERASGPQEGAP